MEMELSGIIEKLKKEGVEEAEKTAENIIKEAERKAADIIQKAEARKKALLEEVESESENFKKASEKALKQAARDVLLMLRERVLEFFDKVIKEEVKSKLTYDVLRDVIVKAIENLKKEKVIDIEILVSEEDRNKLEKYLFEKMGEASKKHITLVTSKNIKKGYRIGEKGKDSYYDFTDEAIAEAFYKYLNPKLIEMLDIKIRD